MGLFGGKTESGFYSFFRFFAKESGFYSSSTAEQVTQGIDAAGLTAIVTGSTNGIGKVTTRVLTLRDVHVIMGVRNVSAGEKVKEEFLEKIPGAKIDVMEIDLNSLASVRKFASDYISYGYPLNILINNSGIVPPPKFTLSKDNIEQVFAVNHLCQFLLTNLLMETMKNTARDSGKEGRIINIASDMHRSGVHEEGIRFDNINDEKSYSSATFGKSTYGVSKLCNVLHANELARCFKGASTTCYLALNPKVEGITGEYFVDNNKVEPSKLARDSVLGKKLWDYSLNLIDSKQ